MDWMHGYFAETGYSYGYYIETMPARLRWASLLHGHIVPERNFRYVDAGCGQGYNLILAAAMHPDSEFVGIDFMPAHIAHGRALAEKCGLDNVTFIEGDFVEMAKAPGALGVFDMAVCHGIATWIGEPVKEALFSLVGQILRPGGVFYNSYNTLPGWLGMIPFQHLVLLQQRSKGGIDALNAARSAMDELRKSGDTLFKTQPTMETRLKSIETQDPAYLTQEYNNDYWRPVFVSEMIDAMGAVKLDFLGTATLSDVFEGVFKPEMRELINSQPNTILREQMRDYAIGQSFRRDIYVKGKRGTWDFERQQTFRACMVVANAMMPRPSGEDPFKIKASALELIGKPEHYHGLLAKIDERPDGISVGELIDSEPDARRKRSVIETLSMMLHGGWITQRLPEVNPRATAVTAAIAAEIAQGAPYRTGPMPATGCAAHLSEIDWILTGLQGEGVDRARLGVLLHERLNRLGRQLAKEGKAVTDEAERNAMLRGMVDDFMDKKLPYFKQIGFL